jgi:hypothetical protein
MAEYRAYIMGEDGHIRSYRAVVCDGDADAMVWAKQLFDGNDIELWSGGRVVIRFNHAGVGPPQFADLSRTSPRRQKVRKTVGYPTISAQLSGYCLS